MQACPRRRVIDRIQQAEQLARQITVAQHRKRITVHKRRVCTGAVFTHAGHIAFYVSRIQFALVEWRSEQNN